MKGFIVKILPVKTSYEEFFKMYVLLLHLTRVPIAPI